MTFEFDDLLGLKACILKHQREFAGFRMDTTPTEQQQQQGGAGAQGGGEQQQGAAGAQQQGGQQQAPPFPENTPVEQMTADQREAYWKHQARKHEGLWKQSQTSPQDIAALQAKAAEFDKMKAEAMTPSEKALADARAEGELAAAARFTPQLVDAAITAEVAGRIPADKLGPLLAGLDRSYFLANTGQPDTAKVKAWVDTIAGVTPGNQHGKGRPDMGQGNRQQATTTAAERGRAEAERRGFIKPAATQ